MTRRLFTLTLLACSIASAAATGWDSVYFYDHASEVLEFLDISAPSAQRIIAVGTIRNAVNVEKRDRHVAVVTSDGGEHWQQVKLDDAPVSLFFLNDSIGWLVTDHGIWKTEESGRGWTKVSKHDPQAILRLWFLDENHGFAVGGKKTVVETKDGGKTWTPVASVKSAPGDPIATFYTRIAFVNSKIGVIFGTQLVANRSPFPQIRTRVRGRLLQLDTDDGGLTWLPKQTPLGVAAGLKFTGSEGLLLLNAPDQLGREAANVIHIPLRGDQGPSVVYQAKDLTITDVGIYNNRAYLVGVEAPKNAQLEAFPRKVRVLESKAPYKLWEEMNVAYNAEATHMVMAGSDGDHVFVATNAGMILRLQQ